MTSGPGQRPSAGVLRAMTDQTVVRALVAAGRATRAELAETTGLSKPTVAEAMRRLVTKGLVVDTGERTTGRGGVGTYFAPAGDVGAALAVVIAPEGVIAELLDVNGTTLGRGERTVDRPADPTAVRQLLLEAAADAAQGAPVGAVVLAVVSAADPVDRATGRLVRLPDSPFLVGDLDPAEALSGLVTGPVLVDNDVNWAARHELALRIDEPEAGDLIEGPSTRHAHTPDFCYLFLGEGLGAALVLDGEVRRGQHGLSGEVAYVLTTGPTGAAVAFTEVFAQLRLRHPGTAAVDLDALRAALADDAHRDAIATGVAGAVVALTAITDPGFVVLGGPWGGDERVLGAVRAKVDASARPVAIEAALDTASGPAHGARAAALAHLLERVEDAARS